MDAWLLSKRIYVLSTAQFIDRVLYKKKWTSYVAVKARLLPR